jgi:hypothetical protein
MPCTFSHPLAVVPLRRFCPNWLNFAALIIGSMSPDFAYYARQFPVARFAHTILGTFTVCLPTGLLALGVFYLLRRPVCFILPQPHRAALAPLAAAPIIISMRNFFIASVSILLGAWSHTIWDSFTHDGAWSVRHLAFLRTPLIQIGETVLPASYALQQTSTLVGGAVLGLMYFLWLRRQPAAPLAASGFSTDGWRYLLFAVLIVVALSIGAPSALRMASHFDGYTAFRVFVFRTGVYSVAVFIPLLALSSFVVYTVHRRSA